MKPFDRNMLSVALFLALWLLSNSLQGQHKRLLKSHNNMKRLEALDPSIIEERLKIEKFIAQTQHRLVPLKDVVLPLVFHILDHADAEPTQEQQVYTQLVSLNRDFGNPPLVLEHPALEKEKFLERMDQMTIQFCLPELKGNIKDSLAINFHTTNRAEWGMDDAMKDPTQGGIAPWNTKKFINIWVVNLADSVSGYAQLPGASATTDGIVIDKDLFGVLDANSPFAMNRTLTHLMGNYLGLHALWGETRCADDYVLDTPIHNSPNYGCSSYKHFSTCTGEVEMTMNFMDASSGECLQFFTIGQKYRLHSFLSGGAPRAQLRTTKTDCSEPAPLQDTSLVVQRLAPISNNTLPTGSVRIFPNPSTGLLRIAFTPTLLDNPADWLIQVVNNKGQVLVRFPTITTDIPSLQLDTTSWLSGVYFLTISTNREVIHTEPIVISR